MKRIIFVLAFFSLLQYAANAQGCLPNGIGFTTQAQIDNFSQQYPNCTEIEGYVIIHENTPGSITNLNGLSQITKIDGYLNIWGNTTLLSLQGLHLLTDIGGYLNIYNNDNLVNLNKLANVSSVGSFVQVGNNAVLSSVSGLTGLSEVNGYLIIRENPAIHDLDGLDNITQINGKLEIKDNASLTSIGELSNVSQISSDIIFLNNPALVNLNGLSNITQINGKLEIKDNTSLSNIAELNNVTQITGNLIIRNNPLLASLSGLDNVSEIGGYFELLNNDALVNLSGLNSLTSIGGKMNISYNDAIVDFTGIDQLNTIGGFFNIFHSNALANIEALSGLNAIGGFLAIQYCPLLTTLTGLENIDPATIQSETGGYEDITLRNNDLLSLCEVLSVCEVLNDGGTTSILSNASGCNTEAEVVDACTPPECTSLADPQNNDTDVPITTNLSWDESNNADGYNLCVGYTQNCDIFNGDVGDITTWTPIGDFYCDTTVYVNIVPYNSSPYPVYCTYESFHTEYVTASAGNDVEICKGESVQLGASGGNEYSWYPADGLDNPYIATPVASPSTTIIYTVTVSNSNGCSATDEVTVTVNPLPVPNASATAETGYGFNDGTATSLPSEGTPGYTFLWSNGDTTPTIVGLPPADYYVTVTDSKLCSANQSVTVDAFICPQLSITATVDDVSCYGTCDGKIIIDNVANGVPPFQYSWSNGDTTYFTSNLCTGEYFVTITDSLNCSVVSQMFTVNQPKALFLAETHNNISCTGEKDGNIDLSVSGGTPGYTYKWNNGATSEDLIGIPAGSYTVTVTDDNGCSDTLIVILSQPDAISLEEVHTDVSCNGLSDAKIDLIVSGGTPGYLYKWNNGSTSEDLIGIPAGNYTVTVTDANGCTKAVNISISQPDSLKIFKIEKTDITDSIPKGSIQISVTGGKPPYKYHWTSEGGYTSDDQNIDDLNEDCYTVEVVDSNNCSVISRTICIDDFSTAVIDIEKKLGLKIFPNPAGEILYIKYDKSAVKNIQFSIYSISGKKIPMKMNSFKTNIPVGSLNEGVYLLKIKTTGNTLYKRFLILR